MYGLPSDFDLSQFKGRKLEMICFAQYSLYLHFSDEVLLTVEAPFLHESQADNYQSGWVEFPVTESKITRLVGREVASVHVNQDGTLVLRFAGDDILNISEIKNYESYRIKTRIGEIIV